MLRPELRDDTYSSLRDSILPSAGELLWRDVPWRRSLAEALSDPAGASRPILLWAMDGSPLGMTCGNGIRGRSLLWADAELRTLAARFVPAADDAGRLARGHGADCEFFRHVAEQGHYGGQSLPTTTRQGVYALTADGTLLGSANTLDPRTLESVLRDALVRWEALPGDARCRTSEAGGRSPVASPGTAVLRVFTRDLPGCDRSTADWNQDHVWLSIADLRALMPEARVGARTTAPWALAERLARFHLVDDAHGQSVAFPSDAIEHAEFSVEVTALDGDAMTVRMHGHMRASQTGIWPVRGVDDAGCPARQARGYDMALLGRAVFACAEVQLRAFELVAAGMRWGGTQFNFRDDDRAPAPLGVVFQLCQDDRYVPPALGR